MKAPQFYTTLALSVLTLVLTFVLIIYGQGNGKLQAQLQAQQEDINRGSMSQQVGQNLLKDIAIGSQKSDVLKDVLAKNGYTVTAKATPSSSPSSSSPAPATLR